jgi:endonuclease YncB( thermonuclease family)
LFCYGKPRLLATALVVGSPCAALTITDGETPKQGVTYRLWGIDAPEAKQVCSDGRPAGSLAATWLQTLTAGRSIVCQEKDRDRYGRSIAICRASGEDLD